MIANARLCGRMTYVLKGQAFSLCTENGCRVGGGRCVCVRACQGDTKPPLDEAAMLGVTPQVTGHPLQLL